MATDSTNLPQGETTLDAGSIDMTGSDLDLTTVQLAQTEPANYVDLPKGNTVILLPVQPGQTVRLPTDNAAGLPAKIGSEGNLAIVVDGRTIILQGYLKANDQSPIKIVTNDGDEVNVADLIADTDSSLDIQTAAGPAAGGQGDGAEGSGIYVPFSIGPGLGGLNALGVLDPTALQYRLIDDESEVFVLDENGLPQSIEIVPDDGRPVAEDGAFLLDEDFLKFGNKDLPFPSPGDDDGSNVSSGTVVVNFGPDGPRAVNPIVMTGVVNGSESGLFALDPNSTGQGAPILLQLDPPAGGFQVLHGQVGGVDYFTITLNTTTGHFEVEQIKPLWHPDTGTKDQGFEDNVLFAVQFTAFDADGDSISAKLHLSFDDDMPELIKVFWGFDHDSTHPINGVGLIDEDALKGGNPGGPGDQPGGKSADGQIFFAYGADGFGSMSIAGIKITDSAGNTVAEIDENGDFTAGGLKTSDGRDIQITQSGPDGNGVITWTGIAVPGGQTAFTFALDTMGAGLGQFKFTLHLPLQHPFTDPDFQNDGPQKSWEDNLNFDIAVRGTDGDGDGAIGHVHIQVNDDSPRARDDYDYVTEGAGNIATGNVVTGIDSNLLGKDSNTFPFDGTPDSPGADGPYTISKLAHGGDVYTLSADGTTVLKNGAALNGTTETFDGKILKIPTAEGGTFEIIMVSDTQSQVGEYRYTTGPNPDHATHKHGGPETLAESRSGAFDTLQEWTDSFTAAGITLNGVNGNLAIKFVNVAGPDDYRGIGVRNNPGDEVEVDNAGPDEKLEIGFATKTNNAALTIGALFNGEQFDAGNQEILLWEAWDGGTLVASGQILGTYSGVVTLDIDTGVPFNKIVLTPVDNGAGSNSGNNSDFLLINVEVCKQDDVKETFDYTLRDADGDESTATLKIEVKDTKPTIPTHKPPLWLSVDEDGLPAGVGNNDSPHDAPGNSATAIGFIPFNAGADPVTIELSVGNGGDTGLKTLSGQAVFAAWDAASQTLIGYVAGTNPDNPANQVFKMTVLDAATGKVEFELLKPIKHADIDQGGDNTENWPDPYITVNVQIEDADCDVAFTTVKIKIDDDMPVITCTEASIYLKMDESKGGWPGYDAPGGGHTQENDEAAFTMPPALAALGTTIGEAQANGSALFTYNAGADGLLSAVYGLNITGGGATGLTDTATNTAIKLVAGPGGVILGRANNGAGPVVFAIHVDGTTGQVSVAQYRAIKHPDTSEHDEVLGMNSGVLSVTLTVTDKDGDSVTASKDISGSIKIDDDGPKFKKVDWGHDGDSKDGVGLIDEDALPHGNPGGPGDDKGGTSTDGQIIFDYGSDGPGALFIDSLTVTNSLGEVIDLPNLRTADGQPLVYEHAGPDANGVVTLIAYVDLGGGATGDKVFTFELDTKGANIGDFKFELHLPLEHPFTDPDSKNDGPQTAWEDNLNFDFAIIGKDGDGDGAVGHIKIRIDDDSPVAVNDKDSVTEGEGNTATGNVITGVDLAFLGTDANGTDGSKDSPGADQPYTISKLVHDGTTYNLIDNGDGTYDVTKNGGNPLGAGESFDGKVLTIPTKEGATFEIVLVSPTLAEVGEYRYTTGEPPHHDSDKFGGPKTLAESQSDAFDTLGEWTASFGSAGVTLVPVGGSLAIKSVDVAGPNDYRGIGVSSGPGDEVEVDNAGLDEKLQLDFASKTNNATLTIGALFNGQQFDSQNQEILVWEAWDGGTLVGSGQIVGTYSGIVVLDIDTGVPFDKIVLKPLDNGAGENSANNSDFLLLNVEICKQEEVKEKFDYTLRDADGDESSATLTVEVKDTHPSIPTQTPPLALVVDEDGLPAGIGNSDSPNDDVTTNSATATGNIPFTPGADPVTIELSVGNGGDTGLKTLSGQAVFAAWDAASQTLIGYIAGTNPANPSNQVFKMTVTDAATGAVEFKLLKPIKHADGGQDDNTENDPDPYFTVNVEIEDKDCDVAFTTVKITIDDDMPVVCVTADSRGTVTHDESAGLQDDDRSGNPPAIFNVLGAGPAIGWARDGDAAVSIAGSQYGADGPGNTTFALKIPAAGTPSGVSTTDGNAIWLYEGPNGLIVGRVGTDAGGVTPDANGTIIFAIAIDGNGVLTLVQYDSLKHPDFPNNHDEDIGLTPGALKAVVTLTDADGDSASAEADIGHLVRFDDDGPTAKIKDTNFIVQHDETPGVQNPGDGLDRDQDPAGLPANLVAPGTLIGWAKSNGSVVDTGGSSFGSDDEGATAVLSLSVSAAGVNSGLDVTTGESIFLYKEGDVVVGRVGQGVGGNTPDPAGAVAFVISIDPDGKLNVAQYLAIEHGNTNSHDETVAISNSALRVVLTVTDGDGDVATDGVSIGDHVRFDDDGPIARNDTDTLETSDGGLTYVATGNVMTGVGTTSGAAGQDDEGTDTASVSKLVGFGGQDTTPGDGLSVLGKYGTLTMDADGNYAYDFDETLLGSVPEGATDVFTYTLKDGDGDTSTAKLTINLPTATVQTSAAVGQEGHAFLKEDTYGPIALTATPGTGDTVTQIVLSNVPAGWDVKDDVPADFAIVGGTISGTPTYDPVTHTITFDITGAAPGVPVTITVLVKGAEDSDVDGTGLTVSATVVDGPLTVTGSSNFDVTVDAVLDDFMTADADPDDISESAAGQLVDLNITVGFDPASFAHSQNGGEDGDGSEVALKAVITIAGDVAPLVLVGAPIAGVTLLDTAPGVWELTALSTADLQAALGQIRADIPAGFDGEVSGTIAVTTLEKNTPPTSTEAASGNEPDTTDNQKTYQSGFSFTVNNDGGGTIDGSVGVAEDGIYNQYDQTLPQTVTPASISYASVVALNIGEALTSLTITGIPAGTTVTLNGDPVTNGNPLSPAQLSAWINGTASILVTPPVNSDVDFNLSFNGQTTDSSSGATTPIGGSVLVRVDAAADDPTGVTIDAVSASGDEEFLPNEAGTVKVTATFGDIADGSETHTLVITAPPGFTFPGVADFDGIPPANVIGLGTGTVTVTVPGGDSGVSNFILNTQAPANYAGPTPTFTVTATAQETTLSGGGTGGGNADDPVNNVATESASDEVSVKANFVPNADDDENTATNVDTNYQLMLVLDRSGSMDEIVPDSGGKTRFELARDALIALIEKFQGSTNGSVQVKIVGFNNNASYLAGSSSTFVDAAAAIAILQGFSPTFGSSQTDYDSALFQAQQGIDDASWTTAAGTEGRVYWVSDGRPVNDGDVSSPFPGGDADNQINDAERDSWEASLNAKGVTSIAIGIGSDVATGPDAAVVADQLGRVAHNPGVPASGQVIIIDDINGLAAALVSTVPAPVNGNLLTNDTAGDASDPLTGGIVAIVDLADPDSPVAVTQDLGATWRIETALGVLVVTKATGAYTYTPKPGSEGKTDTFQYTIQDTIGPDQDTAILTIDIESTAQTINGDDNANTISGGLGNDTLNGKGGHDKLWGGEGDDIVNGDAGNDYIVGGAGNDKLNGGANDDTYVFLPGDGIDTISDSGGADAIHLLGGPLFLDASRNGNNLVLNYGLVGLTDQITVTDHFDGKAVETISIINGPFSGTYILNTDDSGTITGSNGNDLLVGVQGTTNETFDGEGGDDLIFAQGGNDTVDAGSGDDYVDGGAGNDKLSGGSGDDTLIGGLGNDTLNGGDDDDVLLGGDGDDTLNGDDGDDILDGGAGTNTLNGGDGNDTLIFSNTASTYNGGGGGSVNVESNSGDILDISNVPSVDLTAIANGQFSGIETIRMNGGGNNTLKLNASDVIDLGTGEFNPVDGNVLPTEDAIRVDGDAGDVLQLSDGTGHWVEVTGSITNEPAGYRVFAFDGNPAGGVQAATVTSYVIVDNDITVQTVA